MVVTEESVFLQVRLQVVGGRQATLTQSSKFFLIERERIDEGEEVREKKESFKKNEQMRRGNGEEREKRFLNEKTSQTHNLNPTPTTIANGVSSDDLITSISNGRLL